MNEPSIGTAGRARTFLALGDSYTVGEAVAPVERWPDRLADLLRADGLAVAPPVVVARTGWTTDELQAGIAAWEAAAPPEDRRRKFDVVSLLIGVNDQYRGRSVEEYRAGFLTLLDRARELAGGDGSHVLVLSIPDWGVTPYAEGRDRARIAREIDAFNAVNREAAARIGAPWVDVTGTSRLAARDAGLTASDGLHPTGALHEAWARAALPAARAMLAGK